MIPNSHSWESRFDAPTSRNRLDILHLRHMSPQQIFEPGDYGHDRAGAVAADAAEAEAGDAVGDIEDFDLRAVHVEGGAGVLGEGVRHALFEVDVHGVSTRGNPSRGLSVV